MSPTSAPRAAADVVAPPAGAADPRTANARRRSTITVLSRGQLAHDLEIADREQALADHGRHPHTALACLGPGLDLGGHGQHRRAAAGWRDAEPARCGALGHGLPLHEDRVGHIECAGNQRHGPVGLDSADQDVAGLRASRPRGVQDDFTLDEADAAAAVGRRDAQRVGVRGQAVDRAREDDARRRGARRAGRRFDRRHRPADHRLLLLVEQQVADGQRRRPGLGGRTVGGRTVGRGWQRDLAGDQQRRGVPGETGQIAGRVEGQSFALRRRAGERTPQARVRRRRGCRGARRRGDEIRTHLHAQPGARDGRGDLRRDVPRPVRRGAHVQAIPRRRRHQPIDRFLAAADGAVGGAERRRRPAPRAGASGCGAR